jgi:threonine dehydratase
VGPAPPPAEGDLTLVTLDEVRSAYALIEPHVVRTPLVTMASARVALKAESLQPSGSFKLRGAYHQLLLLDTEARVRGVVAHSSGNHAVAVAMAAHALGVPATIVMPVDAPEVKRLWTEQLGATVELVGPSSTERSARAAQLAAEGGLTPVEPYDAMAAIAATATIALELHEQIPSDEPFELYLPISGGGLIAGVATAAKLVAAEMGRSVRIVGVEPELAADALASRRAGERVAMPAQDMSRTLADGLRVQIVGALAWPHIEAYVDDIVAVTEDELCEAMRRCATEARLVAEPSGAVPVAAALAGRGGDGLSAGWPCSPAATWTTTSTPASSPADHQRSRARPTPTPSGRRRAAGGAPEGGAGGGVVQRSPGRSKTTPSGNRASDR